MQRLLLTLGLYLQIVLGILLLVGMFLPSRIIAAFPGTMTHTGAMSFVQWVLPVAALIVASLPLHGGIPTAWRNDEKTEPTPVSNWLVAVSLVIVGLLLVKGLHSLYWLFIWDSTHDSFDILWLVLLVPIAVFAGLMLTVRLPKYKLLYVLGLPLLPILALLAGLQVDYHELTATRAERVGTAIESYYAQNGRYPTALNELTPRYLLFIPEPTIIYGQNWCYDSDGSNHRLAYLELAHWSSPTPEIIIHQSAGDLSPLPPTCEDQFAILAVEHPRSFILQPN